MAKRALCLLFPGFEEIEAIVPIDLLRRAGVEVKVATLTGEGLVTGRSGVALRAESTLAEAAADAYDLLLLPGGPGVKNVRADGRPAQLAREYARAGKLVAAICAAPLVLADAGLLAGRRFTAHFSAHGELPQALAGEKVVEDGNIITSRGAGTAVDFGLILVRRLCGEAAAEQVAKAIMR